MKSMLFLVAAAVVCATGCQPDQPNTPPGPPGGGHVAGSPQDRIAAIETNPTMTDAEKQRRIAAIKQNNHLQ